MAKTSPNLLSKSTPTPTSNPTGGITRKKTSTPLKSKVFTVQSLKRTMFIDTDVYKDLVNGGYEADSDLILRPYPLPGTRKVEIKIKRV